MFERIIITLDGSEFSERALGHGRDLAQLTGAHVELLSVVQSVDAPFGRGDEGETSKRAEPYRRYLDEHAERLRTDGNQAVTTNVRFGDPARVIADEAREQDADLIVMSTHGLGADGGDQLGSIAMKVLMTAPCPVLMVRIHRPDPPRGAEEERWQDEGGSNVA